MAEEETKDLGRSVVRTIVPYLTVWVVAKLAEYGINADSTEVSGQLTIVLGSVWYAVVRFAEERWPKAGYLLGIAAKPEYKKGA